MCVELPGRKAQQPLNGNEQYSCSRYAYAIKANSLLTVIAAMEIVFVQDKMFLRMIFLIFLLNLFYQDLMQEIDRHALKLLPTLRSENQI